ncbi:hypothetical protein [Adlercreutzia sp. ZJ242]|uniref:hypothetical protein n=1 Tax=Adlercreutzia sp. ZJ242 TaxID=2709409 RepID=UPI0013EA3DD0|nr:hypothetical protein [Adlercreutzia sp. ZJ242]
MVAHVELLYITSLGQDHKVDDLGKKKFQKLVYLIETLGDVDLGYQYQIHLYGPFSKALDDDLRELSSAGQVAYTRQNRSYLLSLTREGEAALSSEKRDEQLDFSAIECVFDEFSSRSPRDLELLTTSCFVMKKLGARANRDTLKSCVSRIKGSKFAPEDIDRSVEEAFSLMTARA